MEKGAIARGVGLILTLQIQCAAAVEASAPPVSRIPVEIVGNHIFVKVEVNGSAPLDFVLDTGATDYGLNRRTADALGIQTKPLGELGDVGTGDDTTQVSVAEEVSFRIGGITRAHKVAYVVAFGDLDERTGHRIDGVIGADLFQGYVVEIDYAQSQVSLFEPKRYRYTGSGEAIPISLVEGRPFVRAGLDVGGRRITAKALIDSGDGATLALHTPFVASHGLPRRGQATIADAAYGVAGESRQLLVRLDRLRIGRFVLRRPVVALARATSGTLADPSFDGSIGGEVLRRFRVVFDYTRRRVHLERNAAFGAPFEVDASGLGLRAGRPDYTRIEVDRVSEPSPASTAGLRKGDRLIALDGRRGVSLADFEAAFRIPGRAFLLVVERGGFEFQTTLSTTPGI